jgi:putative DNA primase/helicase
MSYMRHPDDDLDDLEAALCADIEAVVEALLGPANRKLSRRTELRFGNKGALCVWIAGQKKGRWADFNTEKDKGRLLGLVRYSLRCDWPEAIAWARNRTGQSAVPSYTAPPRHPERLIEQATKAAKAATEAAADEARRIGNARRLWQSSVPVSGPAAVYLTDTRKIPAPVFGWPAEAVRFHKPSRSLILAATTADGAVQAVQRVYLTNGGRKIDDTEVEDRRLPGQKQSGGVLAGAWIRLLGDPAGPLQLAEGPETGLTVWCATGHETWIALGSVAKIEPPAGRRIIVCADDDARHAHAGRSNNAHRARMDAVAQWRAEGREVQLLYPWPMRRGDKSDFNDLVQAKGIGAVRERINLALNPLAGIPGRVPVQETRVALIGLVERFFAAALAWVPLAKDEEGPPPLVVATDPGVAAGKSSAAHHHAVGLILKLRAADDHRIVVIATPTHALNVEQAARIMALPGAQKLVVQVWHARTRPDPEQADKAMCWDLEAIDDAQDAGADPQQAVCGSGPTQCQFAGKCGYQKQRKQTADIWLVSHELLFTRKPRALGTIAALIIDEGFLKAGIYGTNTTDERALTVDSLRGNLEIPGERLRSNSINERKRRQGEPEVDDRSDVLNRSRCKRLAAIDGAPDGWVLRSRLIAAGITANDAMQAAALTKEMLVDPGISPGMAPAARKAAVEATRGNRAIKQDMALWAAIAEQLLPNRPELSGNAELGTGQTEHGEARLIRLKGRLHIREGWRVPTLIIDATLKINLVHPFYPHAQHERTPPSAAPSQRITQVIDKTFSASGLVTPEPKRKKGSTEAAEEPPAMSKEAQRRANRLAELRDRIVLQARKVAPAEVLVVLQKAVETALLKLGPLPPNVHTGHHNALRGSNEFEHVRLLIIVGRTQPKPRAVELMAEALSGAGVEPIPGY